MSSMADPAPVVAGLCRYGLSRLPPLLAAFEKEIEGVRSADDIEYIHRMRVASRRLRAALPLFRRCFPPRQYARWMKGIAGITRALGEARDTDVQIAFLVKYRKKSSAAWKEKTGENGAANPLEPAIAFLLADLKKRRKQLQENVLASLGAMEKSGFLSEMRAAFDAGIAANRRTPVRAGAYGIPTVAALRIATRLAAMRSFEPWVTHADAVAEHHAMRIAAKKLRYTMEAYGPVYRNGLAKPLARVKMVQELLGDLHDCDVWIDHVARLLLRERGRMRSHAAGSADTVTLGSLRLFLQDRERERTRLYRKFVRSWQSLARAGIWDELLATLTAGRKMRFVPAAAGEEEIRAALPVLASAFPAMVPHEETVTRLALRIFDDLQPLHGIDRHGRVILETAAMLHDTGYADGTRRHGTRSAQRIFDGEALPLDIAGRIIAGLAAEAHSGQRGIESHPLYPLLAPDERRTARQLSAILRVADGLDCSHDGTVQDVRCTIGERDVACVVTGMADTIRQREKARARAGPFAGAFGRDLVIR